MSNDLVIAIHNLPKYPVYILVEFPHVLDLMVHPWFDTECILYQCTEQQANFPSAYFVPVGRLSQAIQQGFSAMQD